MKKELLFSLCLASAFQGMAQEDISPFFLKNNGFDLNFNYDASLSGNIPGDVINEVYGWNNETEATYTLAGTFAYNKNLTFNGSSALPSSGYKGSEGGALGLTTGWGMQLVYSQDVTLPKGTYRLCAAYYNAGTATTGKSMLAWVPGIGSEKSSSVVSFPVGSWSEDTITFTVNTQTTGKIRIGFAADENTGSASQAKLLVDYVKLLCDDMDKGNLKSSLSSANTLYGDGTGIYAEELKAAIDAAQNVYDDENASIAEILECTQKLTEAMDTYKYKNASKENPITMTSRIVNPSFENGTNGWVNNGLVTQTNNSFPGKSGTTYLEKWVPVGESVPDVSISQTIKDIPNGQYRLRAAVGNIQQSYSGSTVNAGEKQTGVCFYADMYEAPVDTMKRYKDLYFTVVDGQVTIGYKAENATGNWICLDNFQLHYVGENTADDYASYLTKYVSYMREKYADSHVQSSARQSLETAMAEAESLVGAGNVDEEKMNAAKAALDAAVEKMEQSSALFGNLAEAMEYASKVQEWYKDDEEKRTKMESAIKEAQAAYDLVDQTDEQINAATVALKEATAGVDKTTYIAQWIMGDVNNPDNAYYVGRTIQSKNWILFWEKGYGDNPTTFTCGNYTIDVDELLRKADEAFDFYTDSLKFIKRGESKTDTYKMVIRLRYDATAWEASGSGVDNCIGLLTLTPWAAPSRNWQTLFHEIGHCFQYQVHCDNNDMNGWMYAPGNGYGCAFWEQCAQWQAYKIMPYDQFENEWFGGYLANVHKHILHESPRYNNYFIQDYWSYKHGVEIVSRLWNESRNPEDAVQAYIRITGITMSEFNDEMYECAARFATWDIPALKPYGESKIDSRPQPAMTKYDDNYWRIDPSVTPENTGHNIIKLNAPLKATTVTACFEGLKRASGYRIKNPTYAEWRYGFVALLNDGTRVYGDMGKSEYMNPTDTVRFECPDNCKRLYFVVSGGPKIYWTQVWDDNEANDEQWPYQVKFGNTNRYGYSNLPDETAINGVYNEVEAPSVSVSGNVLHVGKCDTEAEIRVMSLSGICVARMAAQTDGTDVTLTPGFYLVQVVTPDGRSIVTRKVLVK